jgi:membrane associated rhomboid family serine protease
MIPIKDTTSGKRLPAFTFLIIVVNMAMFIEEIRMGKQIIELYGVSPRDILIYLMQGSGSILLLHRSIFISGFLHAGYIHLFGNMLFLWVFGPAVEREFGWIRFVVFYTIAIFFAFYAHTIVHPHSMLIVIGASGAIAAVMGAYLIFYPRAKIVTIVPIFFIIKVVEVPSIIFMLVWFLLQGANGYLSLGMQTSIAWFAHIGGFMMGMLAGFYHKYSE